MTASRRSVALVILAFAAASVSGARLLRAASPQLPIHAAGFWRTPAGKLEPWQADLRIDGDAVVGNFSGQLDGQLIRGSASGASTRRGVVVTLQAETGELLGTITAGVDGATLSGTIKPVDGANKQPYSSDLTGAWYADPPAIDQLGPVPLEAAPIHGALVRSKADISADDAACSDVMVNGASPAATQNEPEIGVDRLANPNRIVAAAIDYSLPTNPPRVFWYFSADGGATWPAAQRGAIPVPTPATKSADPSVDYDASGNPYIGALAFKDSGGANDMDAVIVARSADNGATFSAITSVATAQTSTGAGLDKPWIVVDRSSSSAYQNRVHVAWTENATSGGQTYTAIRLATSSNGGASFTVNPVIVASALSSDQGKAVAYANVTTAPDGTVYVMWLSAIHNGDPVLGQFFIRMRRCTNGGTTCEAGDHLVAQINPLPDTLPGAHFTTANIPTMAVDTYPYPESPGTGLMYVVWNEYRTDLPVGSRHSDIYFSRSADGGSTWTPKAPVVSDEHDEFFPAVSVDNNHFLRITFYKRIDFISNAFNSYEVTSGNGGSTFGTPAQLNCGGAITPPNSDPGIGDYIANDSAFSRHHIWMDMRNGNQDIYMTTTSGC